MRNTSVGRCFWLIVSMTWRPSGRAGPGDSTLFLGWVSARTSGKLILRSRGNKVSASSPVSLSRVCGKDGARRLRVSHNSATLSVDRGFGDSDDDGDCLEIPDDYLLPSTAGKWPGRSVTEHPDRSYCPISRRVADGSFDRSRRREAQDQHRGEIYHLTNSH